MEIEQKFLLKSLPEHLEKYPCKKIEQGYLCTDPVVRIRRSNDRYILTYKAPASLGNGEDIRVNQEVEVPLNEQGYRHLRAKTDGQLICKERYLIDLGDGHTGELDIFHGVLEGLRFIEVEFTSLEDAKRFEPPVWFGENVSHDKRYSNSFLSKCNDLSAFE